MTAPENSPPVELVDAAVTAWFAASPRAALTRDQQEHFRERMRAALAAVGFRAPAAGDARNADMYWNDADTEGFAGSTLDDAVRYVADDIPTAEMPVTLTFQVAKTLPNVQVLVTGLDSDGDLQYEVIDAASQQQEG
ncbi:MAG: hypothetical protein E2591_00555 [Achromobacter sp.]|uniref:hypothetical protein n=1 Tax=Achromobacter sp. TaxID=134375 RepID=UPI0012C17F9D|nr:hypothetical protein [Achromobacter sp.]